MADNNVGLHKKISSIFDGVPIPKDDNVKPPPYVPNKNGTQQQSNTPENVGTQQPPKTSKNNDTQQTSDVPASDTARGIQPKTPVPTPQAPESQQSEQLKPEVVQSPPKTTVGLPSKTAQSPPKTFSPKKSKADTSIKAEKQNRWLQVWEQVTNSDLFNKLFAPKPGVSPARQKAMTILVPILFIILIFVFIQVFSTPSHKTTKLSNLGPTGAVASSDKGINWQIPEPYPTTLRDPMQFGSVTTAQAETGRLIVKGIVYSEDDSAAVIGTEIVREGEKVSGVTIVKINEDNVEFEMNGKKWAQKVQR